MNQQAVFLVKMFADGNGAQAVVALMSREIAADMDTAGVFQQGEEDMAFAGDILDMGGIIAHILKNLLQPVVFTRIRLI